MGNKLFLRITQIEKIMKKINKSEPSYKEQTKGTYKHWHSKNEWTNVKDYFKNLQGVSYDENEDALYGENFEISLCTEGVDIVVVAYKKNHDGMLYKIGMDT